MTYGRKFLRWRQGAQIIRRISVLALRYYTRLSVLLVNLDSAVSQRACERVRRTRGLSAQFTRSLVHGCSISAAQTGHRLCIAAVAL